MTENKYCKRKDLTNEAAVEGFFVSRLIKDLGYSDSEIRPKTSIDELVVGKGSRKIKYKPDYALTIDGRVRWILDAKSPSEALDDHIEQCSGYCLALNRSYANENPVQYFLLTNGVETRLYRWDEDIPLVVLQFDDLQEKAEPLLSLFDLIRGEVFRSAPKRQRVQGPTHTLVRKDLAELNSDFGWCHQFIYRKDNLSQSAAFIEFVKLVFLKLLSDREIHRRHPENSRESKITVPAAEVRFSTRWIEEREKDHPNPLDALQFQSLLRRLEEGIRRGQRKRIFDPGTHIDLSPETIKGVVEKLEHIDLYRLDADINGRLFETFLNATMRGKDLGQYFTPRSVVKLATRMAQIRVDRDHQDTVLDACCGSGGFLIEAMALVWDNIDQNKSLSCTEREAMKQKFAEECVFGVDVAREPPLARIARINMYLHGDGGSGIFQADALDKQIAGSPNDSPEQARDMEELRRVISEQDGFDVVLTNPPFAKEYQRKFDREARILDQYELGFDVRGGKRRERSNLRSSLMFLERYWDLLRPGGTLVTVIDDSVLGGRRYKSFREFIRDRFLIKAVVSLPGDAFQRSRARVKTSILILEKKRVADEAQPAVFMHYCTAVGVDDSPRQRSLPVDEVNRRNAQQEIEEISSLYQAFRSGDPRAAPWTVSAEELEDRLDVKNCLLDPKQSREVWKEEGVATAALGDWLEVVYPDPKGRRKRDLIDTDESDEVVTLLRVRYDGFPEEGDLLEVSETSYPELFTVREGDLVISNINAIHGAVAVIPAELDGRAVTKEYTVCRAKAGFDPRVIWALLRSPEARANLLIVATGIGRSRVRADATTSLVLPAPSESYADEVAKELREVEELERAARERRGKVIRRLEERLSLEGELARDIIEAFKPPR